MRGMRCATLRVMRQGAWVRGGYVSSGSQLTTDGDVWIFRLKSESPSSDIFAHFLWDDDVQNICFRRYAKFRKFDI